MLERRSGRIVAITSETALSGGQRGAHYVAAMGAVVGLVRSLAAEVGRDGVSVNSVAPGPTLDLHPKPSGGTYDAPTPPGRLVRPSEVAESVLFLSNEGTFFTGQTLAPAGAVV